MTDADQLRSSYLAFFEKRGHATVPSASLVPENDPTTLFTGSGMQPMVPFLLGQSHPKGKRICNSQKSFRSQDVEEVGDNRHTTFFEMLGNWSLGDYFKHEQLAWFFEFLTKDVKLDPARLYVSVFAGNDGLGIPRDQESADIWQQLFKAAGIKAEATDYQPKLGLGQARIFFYDEKKNWWSRSGEPTKMPAGEPGGPDSEVFYDFGAQLQLHEQSEFKDQLCHPNCDCGRFLEIGNSVFMQYLKQVDGSFKELPQKNVDFGGGLERILAAKNNDQDVFSTDLFQPIITELEQLSGKRYKETEFIGSFRVIADHLRAAVMLAADGVFPSNKEQGYFSRRLVRRAIRHSHKLGIKKQLLKHLVPIITKMYEKPYPEVSEQVSKITDALVKEEEKFIKTLYKALHEFDKFLSHKFGKVGGAKQAFVTPADAFRFYESWGWPIEIFIEEATSKGVSLVSVDDFRSEFESEKAKHAEKSRTASIGKFKGGLQDASEQTIKYHTATHLLQAALRKVLGEHVQQKGSNITQDRLRFDFSHSHSISVDEQNQIMALIQNWIAADLPVSRQTMSKQAALESGAIAFFIEKYPDQVSVYTIGNNPESAWISKELCGGPHVSRTAEIGQLQWLKEQPVAAGIRRIYLK